MDLDDGNHVTCVTDEFLKRRSLEQLVEEALDYAHCHGLAMRLPNSRDKSDVCQSAPLALFPSMFPAKLFQQAQDVQDEMLELYFHLSWDHDFLIEAHKEVIKTDEFIRKMVEIYEEVWKSGIPQSKTLIIQRSDYMCNITNNPEGELKQIEVNNIASSMGGLAQRATKWHGKIVREIFGEKMINRIPSNEPIETIVQGLYHGWLSMNDKDAAVLVVVEDVNQNQLDQRFVEYRLVDMHNEPIKIIRLNLTQCSDHLTLEGKNLIFDGKTRISLVYFRSGYSPNHYHSDKEWDARLLMEKSNAIKCPWIGLQLANTKKVQQVISQHGFVEKYFPEKPNSVKMIRKTFAGLWGLETQDEETKKIISDAIDHPEKYVLKPQLEGGGGNFYGEEIPPKLKTMNHDELAAHILMERIQPMVVKNVLLRALQPVSVKNVVSELGIYGYLFGDGIKVQKSYSHGHILRTKAEDVNEDMSGNRPTPSKLVPIAARPPAGDLSKVNPIAPALPKSGSVPGFSKNGSPSGTSSSSSTTSTSGQKRKIAPKPEDLQKSEGQRSIPLKIAPSFQIGKIIPRPAVSGSVSKENPIMFPMGANASQLQKFREAMDAASTEQRQTAPPAQTQLRPNTPVPIAPRPTSLVVPKTGVNLGNIESTPGSGTTGPPKPPQILPKPMENKPQPTVMGPGNPQMLNSYMNPGMIRLYSNSPGTLRLATPGQAPTFGIQGIQLQNPALRFQLNPSVGVPGPPISQAQNLQMQQFQMFLQQQKPPQVQQLPSSIFPASQPQNFIPQSSALPNSSNNQMPMLMISNQGIRSHLPGNQLPSNLYAHLQAQQQQQQLNLSLASGIPSSMLAKPTMVATGIPGLQNGNSVLLRPWLVPSNSNLPGSSQQVEKKDESDDDENEPPPLLLRDETMPSDVNDMFVQEATSMRQQVPASDPIRHVVDGFVIEESDTPFEIDKSQIESLEVLKKAQEETGIRKNRSKNSKEETILIFPTKPPSATSPCSSMARARRSASIQKDPRRSSSAKSLKSPNSAERPPSTRQNRELAQLLQMDFGPGKTPFKTTSPQEYAKEIEKQQSCLRPTQVPDYQERDSPELMEEGSLKSGRSFVELNEELCLNCQKSFAELGKRNSKYVQLSTDDPMEMNVPGSTKSPTVKIYMKSPTRESVGSVPSPSTIQPSSTSSGTPDHIKILEQAGLDPVDAPNWGLEEVAKFVNCITNSVAYGEAFKQEEIDGESLLILEADALKNTLQMKLGPALKIMKAIEWLKNGIDLKMTDLEMYDDWPLLEFTDVRKGILSRFSADASDSVAHLLIKELVESLDKPQPSKISNEQELEWMMQIVNHSFSLSFANPRDYETIHAAVRIYLTWSTALTSDVHPACPQPLRDHPDRYFRRMLEAMRLLFVPREASESDNVGIKQAAEIKTILTTLRDLSPKITEEFRDECWSKLILFLLAVNSQMLDDPNVIGKLFRDWKL
ncbi:hypothetical protein FO519_004337 [Halicephalobus sp. NKZ332]|nr:hypothetical protein FO519_004337 [Halicephalobus sp. NKZ332]